MTAIVEPRHTFRPGAGASRQRAAWRYLLQRDRRIDEWQRAVGLAADDALGCPDVAQIAAQHGRTEDDFYRAVDRLADLGYVRLHANSFIFRRYSPGRERLAADLTNGRTRTR